MESSSSTLPRRPPHRRRLQHSSSNAGAYNDVVLSRAGKMRFEPHEYVEMFGKAHSSPAHASIPVLDLSELDERVGSDRRRSYNPDYSNIFGGGLDDDVAAPHDALVNNNVAAKKTKTLIPTDVHLPRQESGLQHSPGKVKRSSPNQSIDGIKQPMSFNKTNENNSEASNRKTHTAQQNPVSGFTYFGDATPLMQKTESERPASSLKHEVSRTWSFSAEINGKSNPSKALHNQSVLNDNKDLKHSTLPTFASKEKNTGESSPSFFDLEIDENSAAGISSAALRRAIEQAEQSIRIAKMIMERRKGEGGLQDVSKPWINGRLEVKDKKETTIDHDDRRACEVDGKSLNSEKPEMREVRENVEAGKKLRDTFTGVGKKLASLFSGTETSYVGKRVEMETVEQNIEAAEACTEAISIAPGLVVPSAECKSPNLESQEADHNGNIISSWVGKKFASPFSWMETSYVGKRVEVEKVETAEASMEPINITSGLVVASAECRSANLEYPEADNNGNLISSANKFDEMEAGEEKLEQDATTHIRGPESIAEEIMLEGEKILGEEGNRKMRIFLEDEAMQKTDEVVDDNKQKGEKNFVEEPEEMVYGKHLAEKEVVVQEKMEKKSENGHRHEKNCDEQENGTSEKEAKEEINEEPEIFAEVGEVEEEVVNEVREPNIDEDELKLPEGEIQQNKIGQRYMDYDTSEYEAAEHILTEPNNFAQVQKSVDLCDAEEANDTLSAAEIIEEIQKNKCEFEEADREEDIDEAINSLSDDSVIEFSDNEMPEPDDNLRRSASEENFMRANLHNTFEGPFSDIKNEKIGFVDAYDEEKLIKNEESLETASAAEINMQSSPEVCSSVNKAAEFDPTNIRTVLEQTSADNNGSHSTSNPQNIEGFSARESQEFADNGKDKTSNKENIKDIDLDEREFTEDQSESVASQFNSEPNEMEETERDVGKAQNMEENKENLNMKEKKEGSEQKFETNERIEAIRRGREREKDRIAVERAIREARERAFAEARERAMASDKASSMEAKLRAERAAVERATAEARKRALEKARSQKFTMQPERVRFSASSRTNGGLKHSYSSSDLEKNSGASSESAERLKARLERHQRVAERVAQALAEKNMRDLLAQKEQAVRNRLAESLDADIKRWATGKEGNLRALLSTLQYILGPDSGWQPLPLTEIVTTAAVKKAYRKATLYVHPDKLQQRGASIRQKYICEKVFDLLKAAWNRFNSEER